MLFRSRRLGQTVASLASTLRDTGYLDFGVAVALAALLAMGVFHHASKRGNRHATAWGIATFLLAGVAVPLYFSRYWLTKRRSGG